MSHIYRFYFECFRYAWRGSIDLANAWGSMLGALVIWFFLKWFGISMALPDTLLGTITLAFACAVAAWVVIFLVRLCAAPAHLFSEQQRKIDALSIPQNSIPLPPLTIMTNPIIHHHHYPPSAGANPIAQDVSNAPVTPSTGAVDNENHGLRGKTEE